MLYSNEQKSNKSFWIFANIYVYIHIEQTNFDIEWDKDNKIYLLTINIKWLNGAWYGAYPE